MIGRLSGGVECLALLGLALLSASPARGQTVASSDPSGPPSETARRFDELAPRLVASARIQPGDLVSIDGGPALVPAMEALAVEVQKAGAFPVMILDSPR